MSLEFKLVADAFAALNRPAECGWQYPNGGVCGAPARYRIGYLGSGLVRTFCLNHAVREASSTGYFVDPPHAAHPHHAGVCLSEAAAKRISEDGP